MAALNAEETTLANTPLYLKRVLAISCYLSYTSRIGILLFALYYFAAQFPVAGRRFQLVASGPDHPQYHGVFKSDTRFFNWCV